MPYYALLMYQSVNLVGHQNVSLLHIRHDESVLSPMLAFLSFFQ